MLGGAPADAVDDLVLQDCKQSGFLRGAARVPRAGIERRQKGLLYRVFRLMGVAQPKTGILKQVFPVSLHPGRWIRQNVVDTQD